MHFMSIKESIYLNNKNHIYPFKLFIDSQLYWVGLSNKNDVSEYSAFFYWGKGWRSSKKSNDQKKKKIVLSSWYLNLICIVGQLWTRLNVIMSVSKNKMTFWPNGTLLPCFFPHIWSPKSRSVTLQPANEIPHLINTIRILILTESI